MTVTSDTAHPFAAITAAFAASMVLRQSACMCRLSARLMPVSRLALSLPGPSSSGPYSNHSSSMKFPGAWMGGWTGLDGLEWLHASAVVGGQKGFVCDSKLLISKQFGEMRTSTPSAPAARSSPQTLHVIIPH